MKLNLFDYNLPKNLIANRPTMPRDSARLFTYDRMNKKCVHEKFYDLQNYLSKGDVLVLNNTRVIPARIVGRRIGDNGEIGRKFKILLLENLGKGKWSALIDGKGREVGSKLFFGKNLHGKIVGKQDGGVWHIQFDKLGKILERQIYALGKMPLPPYIKQTINFAQGLSKKNKDWYQTVYAKYAGSIAAPTAGLHFTKRLLTQIKKNGIKIEYITLHVGMGTFMPVKTANIEEHKIHSEFGEISKKTAYVLNKAKKDGRKIIAVGTTVARTLEAFVGARKLRHGKKKIDIFIYPPYVFKYVDALITNFHLPKSTLLIMISAFLSQGDKNGIKIIKELYKIAIKKRYKFYSYGDAMMIL